MDMIPGRTNTLVVRATKPGRYRGVCAEFCGLGHALMAFDVVAMEPAAFDAWLDRAARPRRSRGAAARRGAVRAGMAAPAATRSAAPRTRRARSAPTCTHIGDRARRSPRASCR